jgi:hypothetical protein
VQGQILAPTSEWQTFVDDAAWMPFQYDARADTLSFAYLPREMQREAVFLDQRFVAEVPKSPAARIRSLPLETIRDRAGPLHFIFHTGYCCSTLLARALDIPGSSMGLKEPSVLLSFGQHWTNARQTPGALSALGVTLDLLSRPLAPNETQIVKPSNVVNHLLPEILHLRPDAKVIVLYSPLRTFLESIALRGAAGRVLARQIFRGFAAAIPLDLTFSPEEQLMLTDLQIAAQAWLMQATFLASVVRHSGRGRIRTLTSDALLADAPGALSQAGEFFGLGLSRQKWTDIAAGPVFKQHAKQHNLPFDADAYRKQHAAVSALHADEIDSVEAWAQQVAQRAGASLSLGDTLIA